MGPQPDTGATEALIAAAEAELGFAFPHDLREAWKLCNCNELKGGWRVFPVFDPANPRKTCGNVVYENVRGAWGRRVMSEGLVSIADNGTGNQLVLRVLSGQTDGTVFGWHHQTHKLTPWKPGLASIKASASKSRESILRLQQQFGGRTGPHPGPQRDPA